MEQIFRMLGIILWMWCPIIHITNVYGNNLKQLSNTDGLSNNAVLSLYQDYDGLLWLGTCDGLNLYDGLNIRPFTLSEGKNLSGEARKKHQSKGDRNKENQTQPVVNKRFCSRLPLQPNSRERQDNARFPLPSHYLFRNLPEA